ncbi:MAG: hypothetical protein RXN93_00280 [Thermocladium sp.]|jgi:hypothetical protein
MQDEVKKLLDIKERLRKRIMELEDELSTLRDAEQAIDNEIKSRSITPADQLQTQSISPPASQPKSGTMVDLKSRDGEKIGEVEGDDRSLVVRPLKPLDPEAKPTKFLIRKLEEYRRGDEDLVRGKRLSEGDAFNYDLEKGEGGSIIAISIRNYRTNARRQEVMNIIRWTIERNLESKGSNQ